MARKAQKHRLPRASEVPALAAFARGYLHQDLIVEYGSATGAATAFAEDASEEERRALITDLEKLVHAFDAKPAAQLGRYFTEELRAAWTPASVADLRSLIAALAA